MKLLSENLFEFQKGLDPVDSLGIGRIALINEWLFKMDITEYKINEDYTIDIFGEILLANRKLEKLPDYIQFRNAYDNFIIVNCRLITLKGCPINVNNGFSCSHNKLTSLEFAPKNVYGIFDCGYNLKQFNPSDVRHVCNVKGLIYV